MTTITENEDIGHVSFGPSQSEMLVSKVLFIDSRVPDLAAIIAAAEPGVKIVVLDANHDGVHQMATALAGMHDVASVSVVSHGDSGVLLLGNGPLFSGNIDAHSADLQVIGNAMVKGGDLLLYGCDVGAGDKGAQFLAQLAQATGADVAASNDASGGADKGGDWNLEISTGTIEAAPVLNATALEGYHYLLHTASVSTVAQLKAAIAIGNTDGIADTITLTGNITFAAAADAVTINVTDGKTMSIVGGGFTLSGGNLARVLNIQAGSVSIDNLTISNGLAVGSGGSSDRTAGVAGSGGLGGGIYNAGNLTISNSTITANKASGGGGSGGSASLNNGGGGGGGGFGSGVGGVGGSSGYGVGPSTNPSAGTGGNGGPGGARTSGGGFGGTSTGGAGGSYGSPSGYSAGGAGGTANNGSISIGGGGGGAGGNNTGGGGGGAVGAIYNTNSGTITIIGSTISNNIGAGGGGGGGGAANYVATGNGGAGGVGVGGIWNAGGTVQMTSGSYATMATGNFGGGGAGGDATGASNLPGAAGTGVQKIYNVGGIVDTNYALPPTITSATYDASAGTLVVTGADMVMGDTIDVTKLSLAGQGGSYTLTSPNVTTASATSFTVTLNATDRLNINGILNKNGTSAVDTTTFNLAAAASWDTSRTTTADLTGNAVTVSSVAAPTITSATYDAATSTLVVTGTGLVKTVGATNDITVSKLTITGEGGSTYTLSTSANVEITSATSFSLTLTGADIAGVNALLNKNGTASLSTTTYNLAVADDWDSVITGGNIDDLTGNGITTSNALPAVQSATYDASTGTLVVTGANMVTGDTIDVSKLSLAGQGGSYTLTSPNVTAASATSFTVTLNAADQININGILNKNGTSAVDTTTFNLAAAASWDASRTTSADLTGNGVTVSNIVAPTITSATYDAATSTLVVTGTGLVKTVGATNDITVSKLTITGEGGSTYTLSTSANVEITSATSFSVTLTGADIAGVNALLNKNGTASASSTTYNVAAADDWDSVITGGNIADLTGNGITVSNASPIVISTTYDASTGTLVVTGANMVTGDTIDVSKLSLAGQGGSYTLTSPNVTAASATSFTVTLNAADLRNINGILNKNGTSAVDTTTFNLAAAASWDASRTTSADLTGNGVTVSNIVAPTITSATYDAATSTLVVTGTGLVKTVGATNDITVSKLTITGEGGSTYTLSTSANVEITSATSFSVTLTGADIAGVNALLNKNGTASLSATTYNVAAADDWDSVITGGNIADLTGNGITTSNALPAVQSATYDASTGTLVVTGANMVTGDTIDVSKLSLTGQGGSYTLTSANVTAASATSFTVTLNAADQLNVNGILNKNGTSAVDTTTFNLAAAASWDASRTTTADLTGNGVTVSNIVAPTITSATYDGSMHVFTVTGTNLVKTVGATNDITVSKLTITGEGGATYTLSTTGNVEVTSATSFTFTLAGADIAAVDSLLNKNGTSSASSSTTYNLAAADDWDSVSTGGNIADLTGNGITVSNAAPSVISSTYDAATGILSVSAVNIVGGDTIDVSKLSLTGQGGSYTLTSANVTASGSTAFSVTLNSADKLAINGILNNNGTTAVDTTTFNLAAAASWDASTTSSADLTGNAVTVSNVTAPTITSATYDVATHVLTVTGTNLVKTVGVTNDIAVSSLTITGEGAATRTLSTTGDVEVTSATSFSVTLSGADQAAVEALFNKNGISSTGGTTYNLAAGDDWDSVITGGNIAVTTAAITVSNVAVPTITSSTYDASTGVLTVTGTGLAGLTGAGNDIVANKFSLQGEGGASYTLTTTSNAEIASATSFTLTLSAADRLGVNLILNKNGTSSTSVNTYNLIAAEDWNAGADSAVVIADLTGNGITVSNVVAPTVTSATYNVATGVLVVAGANFLTLAGANNDITANRIRFLGQGAFNYTLTDTANVDITSNTSFTMTMSANDKAALALRLNKDGTSSTDLTTYNIGMLEDWNAGAAVAVVIADLFGNPVTVSGNPATLTSATYNASTGVLSVTGSGMTTGDTIDPSKLTLTGEGGATYTLTSVGTTATSATAFALTLNAADKLAVNGLLNQNGTTAVSTTVFNLGGAANWDSTASAPADLTGNGVTVSNVTAPTITSATYDVNTHVLTVTGTNLVKTVGVTNDITVAKLTITGEGGVTRVLTTTSDVEITSATSFAVTLSGADLTAVAALLNANGTSSSGSTVYNLAAADDWDSVIGATDTADATNAITVSGISPPAPPPTPDPTPTPTDSDSDGVSSAIENAVPGLAPLFVAGDGNGDGIQDSAQASVASASFLQTPFPQSSPSGVPSIYVTLVADSLLGKIDTIDTNSAQITSLLQKDAPSNLPVGMKMPLGLFNFSANVGTGNGTPVTETFSIYVDPALGINGYWSQDSTGTWVNLASALYGGTMVTEGGKLRLDFQITDGGQFDTDGQVNGAISERGAAAVFVPPSLLGHNSPLPPDGHWL